MRTIPSLSSRAHGVRMQTHLPHLVQDLQCARERVHGHPGVEHPDRSFPDFIFWKDTTFLHQVLLSGTPKSPKPTVFPTKRLKRPLAGGFLSLPSACSRFRLKGFTSAERVFRRGGGRSKATSLGSRMVYNGIDLSSQRVRL